jgi:hypothetical protein
VQIHPVHAGVAANDRSLHPASELCQSAGIPLVMHCGTSTFPGSSNAFADPILLDDVLRVAARCPGEETAALVPAGNAARVYNLKAAA